MDGPDGQPLNEAQQRLMDQLNARRANRRPERMISINWTVRLYRLVKKASQQRGISMSAFCRRASVAMACSILELDYYDEMVGERGVRSFGESGGNPLSAAESKDGRGYGEWRIRELG